MPDFCDRAQRVSEQSLTRALAAHRMKDQIEHHGECIDCGEEIPAQRRRALPYARRCVECQHIIEQRRRAYH
ncbi:TraR/DksA family transcriptional regulator [Carnimonas bestiolae]|uniref:TraR/DksA family transcriptional regulator n=1 Tax=Carnimonas bestiolae TaxID=3402172 RepID=UPI003EDBDE18